MSVGCLTLPSCSLCLGSGISLDLFGRKKKFDVSCLFTGFTEEGKTESKAEGLTSEILQATYLRNQLYVTVYRAS